MVDCFSCAVVLRVTDERNGCNVLRAGGNLRVVESRASWSVLVQTKSAWSSDRSNTLCAGYTVLCFVAKARAAALNRPDRSRPRNIRCRANATAGIVNLSAPASNSPPPNRAVLHALYLPHHLSSP